MHPFHPGVNLRRIRLHILVAFPAGRRGRQRRLRLLQVRLWWLGLGETAGSAAGTRAGLRGGPVARRGAKVLRGAHVAVGVFTILGAYIGLGEGGYAANAAQGCLVRGQTA